MKIDIIRFSFALLIGWALVIIIGFPSWFIYDMWISGQNIAAMLVTTLIISCFILAYWGLGKIDNKTSRKSDWDY